MKGRQGGGGVHAGRERRCPSSSPHPSPLTPHPSPLNSPLTPELTPHPSPPPPPPPQVWILGKRLLYEGGAARGAKPKDFDEFLAQQRAQQRPAPACLPACPPGRLCRWRRTQPLVCGGGLPHLAAAEGRLGARADGAAQPPLAGAADRAAAPPVAQGARARRWPRSSTRGCCGCWSRWRRRPRSSCSSPSRCWARWATCCPGSATCRAPAQPARAWSCRSWR
jgi:hypothetical protein